MHICFGGWRVWPQHVPCSQKASATGRGQDQLRTITHTFHDVELLLTKEASLGSGRFSAQKHEAFSARFSQANWIRMPQSLYVVVAFFQSFLPDCQTPLAHTSVLLLLLLQYYYLFISLSHGHLARTRSAFIFYLHFC